MAKKKSNAVSSKSMKPVEKAAASAPSHKTLLGLSKKDRELVAHFGPSAIPEFDKDGTLSQRSTVFSYVHQVATKARVSDPEAMQQMLFRCLLIALQQKDGAVFRHVADMVEAVSRGLDGAGYFPYANALLKAQKPSEEVKKNPALLQLWGDDFKPTNSEVLKFMGKDPNDAVAKRSLRRAKAALNVDLTPGKSGPPKKRAK